MQKASFGVFALVIAFAVSPARAAEPPLKRNELTFDLGAASFGMTHAWRSDTGWFLFGGGGAVGFSPLLGATYATGTHYDNTSTLNFAELLQAQLFARIEPSPWLRVDGGVRVGFFAHAAGDVIRGGPFVGLFLAPALGWRWLWVGPRISGNFVSEDGDNEARMLVIEYVMVRLVKSW